MKRFIYLLLLLAPFIGCNDDDDNGEDYREPFIGLFNFTTIKNTMVMCNDTSPDCIDGWKVINSDTIFYSSDIIKHATERLKIQFGNEIIGIDDNDSIINQTFFPIISNSGVLSLPEYPIGGHNKFEGLYTSYNIINMNFQFGFQVGGYDAYQVVGIRAN